jgi:hypothetical protein
VRTAVRSVPSARQSRVQRRIIEPLLFDAEEPAFLVAVEGIHRVV